VAAENGTEERVWALLIKNLRWSPELLRLGIAIENPPKTVEAPALQIFEVVVAAIFARICPDYDWSVSQVSHDNGVDFVGRGELFQDGELDISAAITVGGQCKKQNGEKKDIIDALGSSLTRMADAIDPTFFVVALSARHDQDHVDSERKLIERDRRRHCHIFHRAQIESFIHNHLTVLSDVLNEVVRQGKLEPADAADVLAYFTGRDDTNPNYTIEVPEPGSVLAGKPFRHTVRVPFVVASTSNLRMIWRPTDPDNGAVVTVLDPIGVDGERGVEMVAPNKLDRPVGVERSLEMLTYAVGEVDLGEVLIRGEDSEFRVHLGRVLVGESMTPRFYEPPFRAAWASLEHAYGVARGAGVETVGLIGAGGSGKSRLCEEFARGQIRSGCTRIVAEQAKTLDAPYRILSDLFAELVGEDLDIADRADRIIEAVGRYDRATAERATPAIRAIFGNVAQRTGAVTDRSVVAALLVLLVARSAEAPLIVHMQELHWCSADVLLLLDELIWELKRTFRQLPSHRRRGLLIVLEGRVREQQLPADEDWSSRHFEAFLQKLDCPTVACPAFEPEDGLAFVRRLFEKEYVGGSANAELLRLQQELVERIFRSAGGNPFHTLEQVRAFKQSGVLGQNPRTGLLYLIRPQLEPEEPPDTIFKVIHLRWRYLRDRSPQLALLIWSAGLIEDRIPTPLFRRLWEELAPEVSLRDVDATEMLWTGGGEEEEVAFRHEHYFRSISQFAVPAAERERVVSVYSDWLAGRRNPTDRFRRALALLELPKPDTGGALKLMATALCEARKQGNLVLARRIATRSLNASWEQGAEAPLSLDEFFRLCDEDLALIRDLLDTDRAQAAKRLKAISERLDERLPVAVSDSLHGGADTQRRRLTADILRSQILYNDGSPAMAAEVSAQAVSSIEAVRIDDSLRGDATWEELEMEARFSQASALALSGRIDDALGASEGAIAIARGVSSPLAYRVVSTYANILLARDPERSEAILRECLAEVASSTDFAETRHAIEINLGMALVLRAYQADGRGRTTEMLGEAREVLTRVFTTSFQAGQYALSAAAALMRGIVSALNRDGEDITWFAQALAAASRGHKTETLWRAHINLATAIYQANEEITDEVRDHAHGALEFLDDTLAPYPDPDRSPRFDLVRVPLAQATRFLIAAGDDNGRAALVRYPELRKCFADIDTGELRRDPNVDRSHEWLCIEGEDYVIY
jgi:hypothetical protein